MEGATPPPDGPLTRLDNRGLLPPEPMLRTLAALEDLAPGDVLEIHNDRVPVFLLPHLDDAGARYEVEPQPDGSAKVRIRAGGGEGRR